MVLTEEEYYKRKLARLAREKANGQMFVMGIMMALFIPLLIVLGL